jgi:alginate O-acetyltransferase complex protein AlgI
LSTWFRDYFYISLGGNRVSIPRWYFNLFFTFLVSGLWHGANWTFIMWGAINGIYIILELAIKPFVNHFPKILKSRFIGTIITFILIDFAWIFFRASSIQNAFLIIKNMFSFGNDALKWNITTSYDFAICIGSIAFMEWIHYLQRHTNMRHFFSDKPIAVRWLTYTFIIWAIWIFGVFGSRQFIYFVF